MTREGVVGADAEPGAFDSLLGLTLDQARAALRERGVLDIPVEWTAAPPFFAAREKALRPRCESADPSYDIRVVRALASGLTVAAFRAPLTAEASDGAV